MPRKSQKETILEVVAERTIEDSMNALDSEEDEQIWEEGIQDLTVGSLSGGCGLSVRG